MTTIFALFRFRVTNHRNAKQSQNCNFFHFFPFLTSCSKNISKYTDVLLSWNGIKLLKFKCVSWCLLIFCGIFKLPLLPACCNLNKKKRHIPKKCPFLRLRRRCKKHISKCAVQNIHGHTDSKYFLQSSIFEVVIQEWTFTISLPNFLFSNCFCFYTSVV